MLPEQYVRSDRELGGADVGGWLWPYGFPLRFDAYKNERNSRVQKLWAQIKLNKEHICILFNLCNFCSWWEVSIFIRHAW